MPDGRRRGRRILAALLIMVAAGAIADAVVDVVLDTGDNIIGNVLLLVFIGVCFWLGKNGYKL